MAGHPVAANLLMLVLLVGGLFWATRIKQEVFPDFELDIVNITVPYPGASPQEVERGILLAVEEAVIRSGRNRESYRHRTGGFGNRDGGNDRRRRHTTPGPGHQSRGGPYLFTPGGGRRPAGHHRLPQTLCCLSGALRRPERTGPAGVC